MRQDDTDTVLMQLLMREQERFLLQANSSQEQAIFASLQTNKERYAYAQKKIPNLEKIFPKIIPRFKKCSMTAELLKTDGNKAFVQRQYEKAQELYTLSAVYANPSADSKSKNPVALAIANRSGALFHAKKFKEALVDIENAFEVGYPDEWPESVTRNEVRATRGETGRGTGDGGRGRGEGGGGSEEEEVRRRK